MAPPSIYGDPKITQDEKNGSVYLDVVVTGADPAKTRWYLGDNEIAASDTYKLSHGDDTANRKKLRCEIKVGKYEKKNVQNFDKALSGIYKAVFVSGGGEENYATFTVQSGNAPEFYDKPKIVQRDNGNVIVIKVRGKSHLEAKAEWFKDDKPVKGTDRVKIIQKPDDKEKEGTQYLLEITGPKKEDEAKYKCVLKNAEGTNQQSLNLVFD